MKLKGIHDTIIIERLHSDRAAGFRMLFDKYYTPLCLYSVQIADDFDVAEDIVQAFFVDVWENNRERQWTESMRGYLFTAVRNQTLAYMKRHGNTGSLPDSEYRITEQMMQELTAMEDQQEEMRQREDELYRALSTLSENERTALEMVVIDEKTYKDTANNMGIAVNTLKTYLRRAMKKLRKSGVSVSLLII